ncbi:MAG: hypothetical protein J7574_21175 [Flavobacterium sp.]|uniref:hypothetical protein n=1 Tax=Flavobacterium sp. TaxID=239 RepID=UPI001B0F8734|nr:hypothetical protein [Flavobacterium sp.]MBO9586687.1 hypothetical protein [Flavobacterium sp.]
MEANELKDLEYIKKLSTQYLNILKPAADKSCNAEIKVLNYSELGCVITSMLKLCIMALENDTDNKSSIDVGLVLEQALHLFPTDEMELLDVINEILIKE